MIYPTAAILMGLLLLIWSADRFVLGASGIAKSLNVSPLIIGMIVVGFGTSTPELFVSSMSSLNGDFDMAIGNAIGSNIVNISFILGVVALISPISVNSSIVRKELPILLIITLVFGVLIWDRALSRIDAGILLLGFIALMVWTLKTSKHSPHQADIARPLEAQLQDSAFSQIITFKMAILWTLMGLVILILSSRLLVWGAVNIAEMLGVSHLIIGLTIVAIGTSLPELVTSIIATVKKEHDVAIGNVIGSNMFNILAVTGVAATLNPMNPISQNVFMRDWMVMMAVTLLLLIMTIGFKGPSVIRRWEGALLLGVYAVYTIILIQGYGS